MDKPFTFGILAENDYFINREYEIKRLTDNFILGINTILISPRRWGKSSLVQKAAFQASEQSNKLKFVFVDLFSVRSEEEFYSIFTSKLIKASASKWDERVDILQKVLKTIIPKINFGLDPTTDFSISLDWEEVKKNPEEILNLAETICVEKGIKLVVCIDEFQNITNFEDKKAVFQKKLRSYWQRHQHASYCLYGSKKHMMTEIFENKSMPFYKFGDLMFLNKISLTHWENYIMQRFSSTGKSITIEQARIIAQKMENHPYFVQQLAYEVWHHTESTTTTNNIEVAIQELCIKNNILYIREIEGLTTPQIGFLRAICDQKTQFTAMETVLNYKLGSPSNIKRIKESLIDKEILNQNEKNFEFNDPLFKIWFRKNMMPK